MSILIITGWVPGMQLLSKRFLQENICKEGVLDFSDTLFLIRFLAFILPVI